MTTLAQKILVTTDFSDAAALALDAAALVARQNNASVTIVHVFVPDSEDSLVEDVRTGQQTATEEIRRKLHDALENIARERFAGIEHVKVAMVVSTDPVAGICHYAEREESDLIVISTHGRTGVARMFIGSVAERVVRLAPCPVLTLRSKRHS